MGWVWSQLSHPTENWAPPAEEQSKADTGSCSTPEPLCAPTSLGNATSIDLLLLPHGSSSRGSQQCCSGASAQVERHLIILPHCPLPKRIPHFPSEDEQGSAQLLPFPSTAPKHPAGLKQLLRSHSQKHSARRCLGNHRQVAVSEVLTSYTHTLKE